MNAFENIDRYDIALGLLIGLVIDGAVVLGAPLWAVVLILFLGAVVGTIRHYNDPIWPDGEPVSRSEPEPRPERVFKRGV